MFNNNTDVSVHVHEEKDGSQQARYVENADDALTTGPPLHTE